MATSTTAGWKAALKLKNGTTATGTVKTVSVSVGTLSKSGGSDINKIYAISEAIELCLAKEVYVVEHVQTSYLTE